MNSINKYAKAPNTFTFGTRNQRRLYLVLVVLLVVALIIVSVAYFRAAAYRSASQQQLSKRLNSAVIDAIDQVNRMGGSVQANSASRLAYVRQYVYSIDQLNEISTAISGEAGRLVPQEAIAALYDDLDIFDKLMQTATSSTLEIRTALLTHLTALKGML